MGHRRYVDNVADFVAQRVQRTHSRLTSRAWAFDVNLKRPQTELLSNTSGLVGRHLRGERRAFTRTLETGSTAGRPGKNIALAIGDGDDRVVERSVDVHHAFGNALLGALLGLGRCTGNSGGGFGFGWIRCHN